MHQVGIEFDMPVTMKGVTVFSFSEIQSQLGCRRHRQVTQNLALLANESFLTETDLNSMC